MSYYRRPTQQQKVMIAAAARRLFFPLPVSVYHCHFVSSIWTWLYIGGVLPNGEGQTRSTIITTLQISTRKIMWLQHNCFGRELPPKNCSSEISSAGNLPACSPPQVFGSGQFFSYSIPSKCQRWCCRIWASTTCATSFVRKKILHSL